MNYEEIFRENYAKLNENQRRAVDQIDDPLLVIAGPGTGKTQLLGVRIANMIRLGVDPQNILALTYTENGAREMFERVARFTGVATAEKVEIYTYHGFGQRVLELGHDFAKSRRTVVDELVQLEIIKKIRENLPVENLLLNENITSAKDILAAISDVKKEDISPAELREMAEQNLKLIREIAPILTKIRELPNGRTNDGKLAAPKFFAEILNEIFAKNEPRVNENNPTILEFFKSDFREKFTEWKAQKPNEKTGARAIKPLKNWFDANFEKREKGYGVRDEFASKKALSLAEIYAKYDAEMRSRNLMDFDDMIIDAINLIAGNADFKADLAEKFQCILLDEYQDTNGAESRLVELLTDRADGIAPNVMAVGDDDQAIMAFQGAEVSNIENFAKFYETRGHKVSRITLTENYRSPQEILDFGTKIAEQIDERVMPDKKLLAGRKYENSAEIIRENYENQPAEFYGISRKIERLISDGTEPREIAILAPKHKILEGISGYLNERKIPLRYEKSENILDAENVVKILNMLELSTAISSGNPNQNAFWPKVLAADFWEIPALKIFELAQIYDHEKWQKNGKNWTEIIRENDDEKVREIGNLFAILSTKITTEPFEKIVDFAVGSQKMDGAILSPMRKFFAKNSMAKLAKLAAHLTILRERFLRFSGDETSKIMTENFLEMVRLLRENEIKIADTDPFETDENSVAVMTAFSAKGLEWKDVFLLDVNDAVWGGNRGNNQGISLPKNFAKIKDPDLLNTRRRLFFVAATRAKKSLTLANYLYDFSGNRTKSLSFLRENEAEKTVEILPENSRKIVEIKTDSDKIPEIIATNWLANFEPEKLKNKQIFATKIREFKLSASKLEKYYDLEFGGPTKFFANFVLSFPEEISGGAQFGTIVHAVFDEYNKRAKTGEIWDLEQTLNFAKNEIARAKISENEKRISADRAERDFANFWKSGRNKMLISVNPNEEILSEYSPRTFLMNGKIPLNGRIDRLEIDRENKKITIVDWKTGLSAQDDKFDFLGARGGWQGNPKLHRYMNQLYFYRIQVKNDPNFAGFSVENARLEFVEGNAKNEHFPVVHELIFDDAEEERIREMLRKLWRKIQNFDFAETPKFPSGERNVSVKKLREFEDFEDENEK